MAVIAIYGIAWLADTYFSNYGCNEGRAWRHCGCSPLGHSSCFSLRCPFSSTCRGQVVVSMLPLAHSLGIPGVALLGVLPSVYGYFFIPNYPSDIATVNFDHPGTTVIGKYLLNHSFYDAGYGECYGFLHSGLRHSQSVFLT